MKKIMEMVKGKPCLAELIDYAAEAQGNARVWEQQAKRLKEQVLALMEREGKKKAAGKLHEASIVQTARSRIVPLRVFDKDQAAFWHACTISGPALREKMGQKEIDACTEKGLPGSKSLRFRRKDGAA